MNIHLLWGSLCLVGFLTAFFMISLERDINPSRIPFPVLFFDYSTMGASWEILGFYQIVGFLVFKMVLPPRMDDLPVTYALAFLSGFAPPFFTIISRAVIKQGKWYSITDMVMRGPIVRHLVAFPRGLFRTFEDNFINSIKTSRTVGENGEPVVRYSEGLFDHFHEHHLFKVCQLRSERDWRDKTRRLIRDPEHKVLSLLRYLGWVRIVWELQKAKKNPLGYFGSELLENWGIDVPDRRNDHSSIERLEEKERKQDLSMSG
jgi:hypothetical protein